MVVVFPRIVFRSRSSKDATPRWRRRGWGAISRKAGKRGSRRRCNGIGTQCTLTQGPQTWDGGGGATLLRIPSTFVRVHSEEHRQETLLIGLAGHAHRAHCLGRSYRSHKNTHTHTCRVCPKKILRLLPVPSTPQTRAPFYRSDYFLDPHTRSLFSCSP